MTLSEYVQELYDSYNGDQARYRLLFDDPLESTRDLSDRARAFILAAEKTRHMIRALISVDLSDQVGHWVAIHTPRDDDWDTCGDYKIRFEDIQDWCNPADLCPPIPCTRFRTEGDTVRMLWGGLHHHVRVAQWVTPGVRPGQPNVQLYLLGGGLDPRGTALVRNAGGGQIVAEVAVEQYAVVNFHSMIVKTNKFVAPSPHGFYEVGFRNAQGLPEAVPSPATVEVIR